ncbi:MAG: acetyltransferase [Bdellovibrionaceae bacterium]|nr:acetyltransferase [Pseudobdellovibrionaceae bacterium]
MAKQKVAIIGSKDLAQYMTKFLLDSNEFTFIGYFDDFLEEAPPTIKGSILGKLADIPEMFKNGKMDSLLLGVGYNHMESRKRIFNQFCNEIPFASYIHNTSWVANDVEIGPGCFVGPACIVDQSSKIAENNFFFPGCVLAHDTVVDGHCFFAPKVTIAGNCHIQESCFLGVGSLLKDNITLKPGTQIGAGAVVVKNPPAAGIYVGNPAKALCK